MNSNLFSILQSPDDGTPIGPNLTSEGGIKYGMTNSGVLVLDSKLSQSSDAVYASPIFERWNTIISERIRYYTGKKSIAGIAANWSYRSLRTFNNRANGEWILDIGCGDGAQVAQLKDCSSYIGLDKNMERLEILKMKFPSATAIYGDATYLPFRNKSLKNLYSSNAFEHIWYLKDAVFELYRVLDEKGKAIIVIPTEGGAWNIGRKLISKPHFQKKYPDIDFEFVSHIEHCNVATQVIRTFETFFNVCTKYIPFRIPSVMFNILLEIHCQHKENRPFST